MQYARDAVDFQQPPGNCYIAKPNTKPSAGDVAAIARAYPRASEAKALRTANNAMLDRLAKDPDLSALQRAALQAFKD